MLRRSARITCLVVGVLATVGLSYRAIQDESSLTRARQEADAAERSIADTVELLLDLRASLHAYVAPGQELTFWTKRAHDTIETLKQKAQVIDETLARSGRSLQESLDSIDQMVTAERRARAYATRGEMQLASDVIFTEIRDQLATISTQVQSVRTDLRSAGDGQIASLRNEQLMLAGAALVMWMLIAVLLLPAQTKPDVKEPGEWRNELKQTLQKPVAAPAPAVVTPVAPAPAPEPAVPMIELALVRQVSEICSELSALGETGALQAVLERVNNLLNATGLIVWVASSDGSTLSPVATHGFDLTLVRRIGSVPRDSANVTAAAFRANAPRMTPASSEAPAALAVPMVGPAGAAGVLSIEMKDGESVEESNVALASIVAAQLATLAMPIADVQAQMSEPERAAM